MAVIWDSKVLEVLNGNIMTVKQIRDATKIDKYELGIIMRRLRAKKLVDHIPDTENLSKGGKYLYRYYLKSQEGNFFENGRPDVWEREQPKQRVLASGTYENLSVPESALQSVWCLFGVDKIPNRTK